MIALNIDNVSKRSLRLYFIQNFFNIVLYLPIYIDYNIFNESALFNVGKYMVR